MARRTKEDRIKELEELLAAEKKRADEYRDALHEQEKNLAYIQARAETVSERVNYVDVAAKDLLAAIDKKVEPEKD